MAVDDDGLSESIKAARLKIGMSEEALANAVLRNSRTVRRWEAGITRPSVAVIVALAQVLGDPSLMEWAE